MTSTDPALVRLAEGVLLPGFTGTTVPGWLARAIDRGLAGVCVFAPNVDAEFGELTRTLHGLRDGFVVASDEEGGTVTRLEQASGSSWPSAAALGRLDDVAATEAVAAGIGHMCRAAGIDLALAPVADVNAEPDNPVIGIRSFGATPELVGWHTAAFVRGLQGAGVAASAKHFPGHGSTTVDSHRALPTVDADATTLRERDIAPFAAAVEAGVRSVLTAHVRFPAIDAGAPATMSPALLGILRSELGFDGVVISDALDMHAIAHGVGRGPGGVAALAAGVDLLCTGNPSFPHPYDDEQGYHEVRDAVVAALADGTLSRDRVADAGRRVAEMAAWVATRSAGVAPPAGAGLDAARRVLDVLGDVRIGRGAHVLDLTSGPGIAAGKHDTRLVTALARLDTGVTSTAVAELADVDAALAVAAGRPVVGVVDGPRPVVDAVRASRPDAVLVHVGLPDARWVPSAPSVTVWGDGMVHAQAAAEVLTRP
ncbi:glycoside hydrolase family 3 protein [Pseudonocardia sp. TRM90224]|uniref:glycoside hydrolase family 3 protein n=1 Tax=Pseudonocardia sp. TRM90224 TaxID=2812678 RepID=UPI001E41020D|nr:glycoside hydrolase family 3 N-terminal domain-containing protein [Pseudonocardia sp. TRM90224]